VNINGDIHYMRDYPSPNPNVKLAEITYWSEGLKVKGLLATPIQNPKSEGILYLRGGIQNVGMVRPARITQLAANGFVVFAPYYRGVRGGEGKDMFAGEDRFDAVNAVEVLKRFCDSERIHLFAFSRGGLMALWTGIIRNDITSIVTWGGVSNIEYTYEERVDMRRMMKRVFGGSPMTNPAAYEERTPLDRIKEINASVLIIHGMKDDNVSFKHAELLEERLKELNKRVETWYYPEFTHYFPGVANRNVLRGACQWMKLQ